MGVIKQEIYHLEASENVNPLSTQAGQSSTFNAQLQLQRRILSYRVRALCGASCSYKDVNREKKMEIKLNNRTNNIRP